VRNACVSSSDFARLSSAYGSGEGDPSYDPDVELTADGVIGSADFWTFSASFGKTPGPSGLACAGSVPCE
jgi:hypothetical protein